MLASEGLIPRLKAIAVARTGINSMSLRISAATPEAIPTNSRPVGLICFLAIRIAMIVSAKAA